MRIRTSQDLGLLIRERRRALGLDQLELAQKVGVSRQWLVEVEKGKERAEIGLLLRTLAALDLALDLAPAVDPAATSASGTSASAIMTVTRNPDIDAIIDKARQRDR
jgi:HTH-type transcriptional regulator/antitoxin HipB